MLLVFWPGQPAPICRRRRRFSQSIAFLVFLIASGIFAGRAVAQQPGTLHGATSTLNIKGQPVPLFGVAIKLTGNTPGLPTLATQSDDQGNYQFQNVPPGSYTIDATLSGFTSVSEKIKIGPGKTLSKDLHLKIQEVRQQIEVHEAAPVVSTQSTVPPAQKLTPKALYSLPVVEQKFREELPVTPGVVQIQSGKVYIKGAPEGQSMLLLDSSRTVDPVTGSFSIDVPLDAIEELNVYKAPFDAQYGGFVGGVTSIQTKAAPSEWRLTMHDLNPSLRGKAGHLVGFAKAEPRIRFGGPLWKDKINFAESFLYEMRKEPIRGLPWPDNENKTQGFNSISNLQFLLSQHHIFSFTVNAFPRRTEWANLNALIPRPATADIGQRGYSVNGTDTYQFGSGAILRSFVTYSNLDKNSHGHGPQDMLITPNGLGGDYFSKWNRSAHEEQGESVYSFPDWDWRGKHEFKIGMDAVHRAFDGINQAHPILLTDNIGAPVEQISFSGIGNIGASDTEIAGFGQDHWIFNPRLAVTLGLRYLGQTNGGAAEPAPRLALVYALDKSARTVFRGGIGLFYDRTPLLGGDFAENPERIITPTDSTGLPIGPSVQYLNVCGRRTSAGLQVIPSCSELGSTPRNMTWRLELSHKINRHWTAEVSTLYSNTYRVFTVDPITTGFAGPLMMLSNRGSARYYEYEFTANYQPANGTMLTLSYVHSKSRGDLNTIDDLFVPLEIPVIRRDVYSNLPSDVPDRLTGYGFFKLPWSMTLSPSVDLHSGFPFSAVDLFQNYAGGPYGLPNGLRYPIYFSLSWRVYRDFPIPFHLHPGHKFRLGVYSVNTTGRGNPTAVYNNIASPLFGHFTGLDKRVNGLVIEFSH